MLSIGARSGLILSLACGLFSLSAHAYDVDTHFYGTYAFARFAGIGPDAAAKIATSAQWMDETYLSDPTSMILMPVTGVAKRRLLHFPSSRIVGKLAGSVLDESLGITEPTGVQRLIVDAVVQYAKFKGDIRTLALNAQTEPNHEFANTLIMQGLKEGNLMKCGAGLHTLEDSYAHAGTAPVEGHTFFWHWPDRPFAAVGKYKEMTLTLFKAMVAIRAQLPQEYLDCSLTKYGSVPNCQMDADHLDSAYLAIPEVLKTVGYNVLKDHNYITFALHEMLHRAVKLKYFKSEYLPAGAGFQDGTSLQDLLDLSINSMMLIGRVDSYAIMANFINKLISIEKNYNVSILDHQFIAQDMGLVTDPNISMDDLILSQYTPLKGRKDGLDPTNGRLAFEHLVAKRVMSGYVPIPLDDKHREEIEDDKAVTRRYEMNLRVEHMQALIQYIFNEKIEFVENSTSTDDGFASEILSEPSAEPVIARKDPATTYITFNGAEKNRYDNTVFHYLFPHLTENNLVQIVSALHKAKHASPIMYPAAAVTCFRAIQPILQTFVRDLYNEHLAPVGDEKFYQVPELFARFKAEPRNAGLFPQFFGSKDVWQGGPQSHLQVAQTKVSEAVPK